MVSNVPLVRELGAGRVQLELAEELRSRGHTVETFDVLDAFPRGVRRTRFRPTPFKGRARRLVQSEGARFDVIDALQSALPYDKFDLGFEGLLVSRSTGLSSFYRDFARYAGDRWPHLVPGTRLGRAARRVSDHRLHRDFLTSMRVCDLALLLTPEEADWLQNAFGASDRWVVLPNGLSAAHAEALNRARRPTAERLRGREVSYIGTWDLRKGAADWPAIAGGIRERVPSVRILLLGTGQASIPDLGPGTRVVPAFAPSALPSLLAEAAVGLCPSYTEGWGLGLLEQLTAGIPTVAYASSGPRAILSDIDDSLLVPCGDVDRIAGRAADLLELSTDELDELAGRCAAGAARYRWSEIAHRTEALYSERLGRLDR